MVTECASEDYDNHSDARLKTAERPPPPKRLRRAKDSSTTYHDLKKDSATYSFELPDQAVAATLSTATPQSEEIPIRGFLTLKTFESKVALFVISPGIIASGLEAATGETRNDHLCKTRLRAHTSGNRDFHPKTTSFCDD